MVDNDDEEGMEVDLSEWDGLLAGTLPEQQVEESLESLGLDLTGVA